MINMVLLISLKAFWAEKNRGLSRRFSFLAIKGQNHLWMILNFHLKTDMIVSISMLMNASSPCVLYAPHTCTPFHPPRLLSSTGITFAFISLANQSWLAAKTHNHSSHLYLHISLRVYTRLHGCLWCKTDLIYEKTTEHFSAANYLATQVPGKEGVSLGTINLWCRYQAEYCK